MTNFVTPSEGAIDLQPRVSTLGTPLPARSALKGRKIQSFNPTNGVGRMVEMYAFAALFLRPFRARHRGWQYPGLKPWAKGYSPFFGTSLWLEGGSINNGTSFPAGPQFGF
jgi:hypothetical protein